MLFLILKIHSGWKDVPCSNSTQKKKSLNRQKEMAHRTRRKNGTHDWMWKARNSGTEVIELGHEEKGTYYTYGIIKVGAKKQEKAKTGRAGRYE